MKIDRLMGILTVLLQHERVTAPFLAEKFEVNRRTIGRDIDALCCAGIPVVTHKGTGGGISIAEGFKLEKSVLTSGELLEMISPPVVIDLASYYKESLTEKIEIIKAAISEKRLIEFDYHYKKGESHKKIEPYLVVFQWASWYVFGFCREREDWRMFKLNRLCSLSPCQEKYEAREIPPERLDFGNHFLETNRLVALFDKSAKYLLIDSYGSDSFYETDDGLHFEVGYDNREYIISWLLGFGSKVKVLEPTSLVDEIKAEAKKY
ncbi:MAG: YafY family transcriptional regulator [Defluviitaleaceae bacterium]|nr:YafY family transcriptional regulator [Defluviitaleaceae bacterium]MCL2200064.1 YafY family transcriptional regulator [Defluviitaleaceae bacterium]